jgi:thiol:disulfide interchange protein DsbD
MLFHALLAMCVAGPPSGAEPSLHARPSLICENDSLVAGQTAYLALAFEIDPHWHLYWPGQNDSGGPVRFNIQTPEGFTLKPARWPVPKRQVLPGDILNHVYETSLTIIVPVQVPADAAGKDVEFTTAPDWIVCKDECIAEKGEASLKLHVNAPGTKVQASTSSARIRAAMEALPEKKTPSGCDLSLSGNLATVSGGLDDRLTFFPSPECSFIPDLLHEGVGKGRLRLTLKPEDQKAPRLDGVLQVERGAGAPPAYYWVQLSWGEKSTPRE